MYASHVDAHSIRVLARRNPQVVRCPYCTLRTEFRPMIPHVDGTHICNSCGHTARPAEIRYACRCGGCSKL
jgi:hypothetical protein